MVATGYDKITSGFEVAMISSSIWENFIPKFGIYGWTGNNLLGSLNRGKMFSPGTWSVGVKVILPVVVGRDKINKMVEGEFRASFWIWVKKWRTEVSLQGDKEDHLQLVGRSSLGDDRKDRYWSAIPNRYQGGFLQMQLLPPGLYKKHKDLGTSQGGNR